jgi:hypothetical protein
MAHDRKVNKVYDSNTKTRNMVRRPLVSHPLDMCTHRSRDLYLALQRLVSTAPELQAKNECGASRGTWIYISKLKNRSIALAVGA